MTTADQLKVTIIFYEKLRSVLVPEEALDLNSIKQYGLGRVKSND